MYKLLGLTLEYVGIYFLCLVQILLLSAFFALSAVNNYYLRIKFRVIESIILYA